MWVILTLIALAVSMVVTCIIGIYAWRIMRRERPTIAVYRYGKVLQVEFNAVTLPVLADCLQEAVYQYLRHAEEERWIEPGMALVSFTQAVGARLKGKAYRMQRFFAFSRN